MSRNQSGLGMMRHELPLDLHRVVRDHEPQPSAQTVDVGIDGDAGIGVDGKGLGMSVAQHDIGGLAGHSRQGQQPAMLAGTAPP